MHEFFRAIPSWANSFKSFKLLDFNQNKVFPYFEIFYCAHKKYQKHPFFATHLKQNLLSDRWWNHSCLNIFELLQKSFNRDELILSVFPLDHWVYDTVSKNEHILRRLNSVNEIELVVRWEQISHQTCQSVWKFLSENHLSRTQHWLLLLDVSLNTRS